MVQKGANCAGRRSAMTLMGRSRLRYYFAVLSWMLATMSLTSNAALLQGCKFDESLCDDSETCVADGLFGQCYSDAESEIVKPLVLGQSLTELQMELMHLELRRLAESGFNWPDAQAQCVLAYYKLTIAYELDYDTEFCAVRNPKNIWELIQRIQTLLLTEEEEAETKLTDLLVGGELDGEKPVSPGELSPVDNQQQIDGASVEGPVLLLDDGRKAEAETGGVELYEVLNPEILGNGNGPLVVEVVNPAEDDQMDTKPASDQENTDADDKDVDVSNLELEEAVPVTMEENGQQQVLKKDSEKFSNVDMGLANTEHKIVKGGIQRVEGNRVYMKVAKENLTEEELLKVIDYLDRKVADPNQLYFDEFLYEDGQLSFRLSRIDLPQPLMVDKSSDESENDKDEKSSDIVLDNPSEVASAVYKRRKDIQTLSGVEVDETGIGSGVDVVPVEKSDRDALFVPIMAICALTITSLLSVLAVHIYKNKRNHLGKVLNKSYLPEVIDHMEGKASAVYEELCRQRMTGHDAPIAVKIGVGGRKSKTSSTSSWPDESLVESSELDISTGHVLLDFLQQHLEKPEEISHQWNSIANYVNKNGQIVSAKRDENKEKNLDWSVLPYEDSIVSLQSPNAEGSQYINASKIYDSDPQQVAYIATQAPLQSTVADFWQMCWEQGIALVVNLTNSADYKLCDRLAKYWPEESSKTYGKCEVHLVSEHIWSEDYVIRSLYLKNLGTGETRTVTQFHYLNWPPGGVPNSTKSMLDFRRKVNKSYRGQASPILVHCTDGAGRSGTFCLLDLVANRIIKGVKELDIAASLEHLRDQRMGMAENEEQFKFVFSCVADETSSLLAGLKA